jgi:hypothetical protein
LLKGSLPFSLLEMRAEIGMFASLELITALRVLNEKFCVTKKKTVSVFLVYVIHLPEKLILLTA